MYFNDILGNNTVQNLLIKEVMNNQIPHAQLFTGGVGSGKLAMALAFCTYLFCENRIQKDACGKCRSCIKMFKLLHPDLHFFYPTIKTDVKEKSSNSKKIYPEFQKELSQNYYLNQQVWDEKIKGNNKKSSIRIADASTIQKIYHLKPYEGLYKVFIIWGAETMNNEASSTLLKVLEEPNPKTIFILISDYSDKLLQTIRSRLQVKLFYKIDSSIILEDLQKKYPDINKSLIQKKIIQNKNNYSLILHHLNNNIEGSESYNQFVDWIRLCFLSINKKAQLKDLNESKQKLVVEELINWSNNISLLERQFQIEFIKTASYIFREAFLLNYNIPFVNFITKNEKKFNLENFASYIHSNNIFDIFSLLNNAHYYLNRYANSKILFLDLSFSLGKFLHKKN